MSALSPVIVCCTLYEYQTPDGRISPLIYARLATDEEREMLLRQDRNGLSYEEWRKKQQREKQCS